MLVITRRLWPLLLAVVLFMAVSFVVQANAVDLQAFMNRTNVVLGMTLYLLLGVLTVVVPFASILPFLPIAVSLWGWQTTAVLTLIAWTAGCQLLFEFARHAGRAFVLKHVPPAKFGKIEKVIENRNLARSVAARMVIHGDIVSYAYGIFSQATRREFLLVTLLGAAPAAVGYAYFGGLPFAMQAGAAILLVAAAFVVSIVAAGRAGAAQA